jgi:hypothetical protein
VFAGAKRISQDEPDHRDGDNPFQLRFALPTHGSVDFPATNKIIANRSALQGRAKGDLELDGRFPKATSPLCTNAIADDRTTA